MITLLVGVGVYRPNQSYTVTNSYSFTWMKGYIFQISPYNQVHFKMTDKQTPTCWLPVSTRATYYTAFNHPQNKQKSEFYHISFLWDTNVRNLPMQQTLDTNNQRRNTSRVQSATSIPVSWSAKYYYTISWSASLALSPLSPFFLSYKFIWDCSSFKKNTQKKQKKTTGYNKAPAMAPIRGNYGLV